MVRLGYFRRAVQLVVQPFQLRHDPIPLFRRLARRPFRGEPLDLGHDREQLARVVLRQRCDRQTGLLSRSGLDDVAFLLQPLQRAPYRGTAHTEPRGDVGLDDARAGRQAAPDDQLAQLPVRLRHAVAAACIGLRGTPDRSGVRAHVQSVPGSRRSGVRRSSGRCGVAAASDGVRTRA